MFPLIARLAAVAVAGKLIERLAQHPGLGPLMRSRKGRVAVLAVTWGLRRHPRTRTTGRLLRQVRLAGR